MNISQLGIEISTIGDSNHKAILIKIVIGDLKLEVTSEESSRIRRALFQAETAVDAGARADDDGPSEFDKDRAFIYASLGIDMDDEIPSYPAPMSDDDDDAEISTKEMPKI